MNFKSVLNDVCCDDRIKNGILDIKNPDHVFVLQEYLTKIGFTINDVVDKTASLFEAGRFPDRQAYNKNGILVTFPTKEYRDRAINKGTHFAENPKKSQPNIFSTTSTDQSDDIKTQQDPVSSQPIDVELEKSTEVSNDVEKQKSPVEKKQDAAAVDYILTGETPLVNYSVDEAKRYGFYNKGMLWYNSDGILMGEQIYDETVGKPYIVEKSSLSGVVTKSLKKIDILNKDLVECLQIIKTGGITSKDDTFKTDIYETLPLLVLKGITNLSDVKKLGGDSIPRAVDFLQKFGDLKPKLEAIADEKIRNENLKIYDGTVESLWEIGGVNGMSLKEVYSTTPSDFIHKSIEEFYKYAGKYNDKFVVGDKGKENTVDIILIYGGSAKDVYDALEAGQIEQNTDNSIAKVKDKNIYFALISLKAMSGRVGRVMTQLRTYLDTDVEIQPSGEFAKMGLSEGFFSTVKSTFDKFIQTHKDISSTISEKYKSLIDSFSQKIGVFVDKVKVDMFQQLNADVKNINATTHKDLKKIEDAIEKEIGELNEKTTDCGSESVALTPTLKKNLEDYVKLLGAINTDTMLIEKIVETSKNPSVNKYITFELPVENLYEVKNIKHKIKSAASFIVKSNKSCVSREELSAVLMYRSNTLALQYIDLIMQKVMKDVNLSNPDKIQEEFINLASVLSTEAIFGGNVSLPLIKYTGKKLERLGYKNQFKIKVPENMPDLKLGKVSISLEPKQKAYMVIYLYLFFGISTEDDQVTPVYVVYELRNKSGSSFTFKVEGNKFTTQL
jgi:tRNA(Ser,Leu) C12 N-acetylase TAN1